MVNIIIDEKNISAEEGSTVLAAAKENGIYIPTLCAYEGIKPLASCRLCIVEVEGEEKEKPACALKVKEGMVIHTASSKLYEKRREILIEMFRRHSVDCHHCLRIGSTKAKDFDPKFCESCFFCDCVRDGFCELQQKALEFGIDELPFEPHTNDFEADESTGCVIRNPNKCIKCRRCIEICASQGVGILKMLNTENGKIAGAEGSLNAAGCIRCGKCVNACPTGALYMKEHKDEVVYYAHQYGTRTAAMVCSCVLPPLEKLFKAPEGSFTYEKLIDGLYKLGIDYVFTPAAAKNISRSRASVMLDERLGSKCLIMAEDYAAKRYLENNYPQLEEHFLFYDSIHKISSDYMHNKYHGIKFYNIHTRNSFGAEALESGSADYFINPRELYRIFIRNGVDPARRNDADIDEMCEFEKCTKYEALFNARCRASDEGIQELTFEEKGRIYKAAICRSPSQAAKAIENMAEYDVIRVTA